MVKKKSYYNTKNSQEKCSPEREEKLNLSIESLENIVDVDISNLSYKNKPNKSKHSDQLFLDLSHTIVWHRRTLKFIT